MKDKVVKHAAQSLHLLKNASNAIDASDPVKAGEFLWGSMAQALKAVAANKGIELKNHRQIWDYALGLTKELEDKSIFDAFIKAHNLHSNFYEVELRLEDVRVMAEDIRITVGKLLKLISVES